MKVFLAVAIVLSSFVFFGSAHAAGKQKNVCLKVKGEKIEIHNLADDPIVIDRDGVPDFVATSMMKSISTAKESKSFNILLTGVKRDGKKVITAFDVKIDEKTYTYPKNACGK